MSHNSSLQSSAVGQEQIEPRRLELSLNPEDGSLLAAPLTQVLLATTDALYQDFYNMAHGELDVVTVAAQRDADNMAQTEEESAVPTQQTRRERMSNLSFAQRRHELAWRLAQHGRALQHVAGLTAADASSDFAKQVQMSSTALLSARRAWVQADEAQDAMYFFHAQLFPARAAPHDVYGALDVQVLGRWFDLPADLRLAVDRYETVRESELSRAEVNERWQMAVHDKLLSGEVAWMRRRGIRPLFRLSMRGGVLQLTLGSPKALGTSSEICYPISALLTVVSTEEWNDWTLLSLDVRVRAKTGEFNHQLDASNRQRYDLHRLAALAMVREEARVRRLKANKEKQDIENNEGESDDEMVARPLYALFEVAHNFSLSWQLELLSAQAQALRRGAWAAGEGNQINVTPVQFNDGNDSLLGILSISFWKVDTVYGPPAMGDLSCGDEEATSATATVTPMQDLRKFLDSSNQLVLAIRAEASTGIKVCLSGGLSIQDSTAAEPHTRQTIRELVEASSNPFALSASDALLAATRLCAERKCQAVVRALVRGEGTQNLPPWICLAAERGNISVAARISYHGLSTQSKFMVLFRLACDARTGSFVPTFPNAMKLLRNLASDDIRATENLALRIANTPSNRRRAVGAKSSGRMVRGAFEGVVRSMNVLGQRVGVGDNWEDINDQSASIRERSIAQATKEVVVSIMKGCAMSSLYGFAPLALGAAFGLNAVPDMAGDGFESLSDISMHPVPPLSVLLDQNTIETATKTSDGIQKKRAYVEQSIFALSCSFDEECLKLYPIGVTMNLESPSGAPQRKNVTMYQFMEASPGLGGGVYHEPSPKRPKYDSNDFENNVLEGVPCFASILGATAMKMEETNTASYEMS